LARIDTQLARSQDVIAKYSGVGCGHVVDEKELDQFMVITSIFLMFFSLYVVFLCSLIFFSPVCLVFVEFERAQVWIFCMRYSCLCLIG